MTLAETFAAGPDQLVTASDLVRNFGAWQDRAQRAPVYVLHRGRPRLVLTALDLMEALCAPHDGGGSATQHRFDAVLDGAREPIVLADDGGRVVAVGRAARAGFGIAVGDHVTALAPGDPFLAAAAERVATTRVAETTELRRDGRELDGVLEPHRGGIALFLRDATDSRAQRAAVAEGTALDEAASVDGQVALVRIGLRGYLENPDAALAAMTGVAVDALATARFVTLISIDTRVAVSDAIERAVAGTALALDATLLVARGDPLPVRVALAPIRGDRATQAVAAIIRVRA